MLQLCLPHDVPELANLGVVGSLSCLLCASSLLVPAIRLLHRQTKFWGPPKCPMTHAVMQQAVVNGSLMQAGSMNAVGGLQVQVQVQVLDNAEGETLIGMLQQLTDFMLC